MESSQHKVAVDLAVVGIKLATERLQRLVDKETEELLDQCNKLIQAGFVNEGFDAYKVVGYLLPVYPWVYDFELPYWEEIKEYFTEYTDRGQLFRWDDVISTVEELTEDPEWTIKHSSISQEALEAIQNPEWILEFKKQVVGTKRSGMTYDW